METKLLGNDSNPPGVAQYCGHVTDAGGKSWQVFKTGDSRVLWFSGCVRQGPWDWGIADSDRQCLVRCADLPRKVSAGLLKGWSFTYTEKACAVLKIPPFEIEKLGKPVARRVRRWAFVEVE